MKIVLHKLDLWRTRWRVEVVAPLVVACLGLPQLVHAQYTEKFEAWSATSPDTWETKDLAAAPFNVPANAVVEVAVRNRNSTAELWGGVRAVGSGLERRFQLQESEGATASNDILVMHVQSDASSDIQHYSDVTADVDFVLLGYWTSGTFVERFDTFTAGASASWQDKSLCQYGVVPSGVAEIVMTNDDPNNEHEAGVRINGSVLERRLNLHEAEDGGVDTATMFVKADGAATATVEVYAETDANIDFYVVGYWSAAPRAYTELFTDVGSPGTNATWENLDLTASSVPDDAIAEFVLSNNVANFAREMGVRSNGSLLSRFPDLHEAESGGTDLSRMHVTSDATATIEFYHESVAQAHTFRLVGYWDSCDTSIEYVVSDLGAVTGTESSLGLHINASGDVAGFDEDASGDPGAWFSECGSFNALGTLGGSDAEAHGVNDAEMVVGWAHDAGGERKPFTWTSGGGMTDLGLVASRTDGEASGVNSSSEVVGTVLDFGARPTNRLAFIYLPAPAYTLGAGMSSLGTLGGAQSVSKDINDSGQVVGGAENGSGNLRPFRWANGVMTDLGTLGSESRSILHRAQAINGAGDVVGMSFTAGGDEHGFLWDGSMTDLGVLTGGDTSRALGINAGGKVVGTSNVTGGDFHAFIWVSGTMTDLNDLIDAGSNWTLTRATDINDDGSIVGWGTNPSSDVRAFLLTPTCNAGGGASFRSTAGLSGFAQADLDGALDAAVIDEFGQPLASILVTNASPGQEFTYRVTAPASESTGAPGPSPGTLAGFEGGVALLRTMIVETAAVPGSFDLTVSMSFTAAELADAGIRPEDVELHVLDESRDPAPGVWVVAGNNIGESDTSGAVGASGYLLYSDNSVDYWAVSDDTGVFAVGASLQNTEANSRQPMPQLCGIGVVQAGVAGLAWLFLGRTRRRRC